MMPCFWQRKKELGTNFWWKCFVKLGCLFSESMKRLLFLGLFTENVFDSVLI